MNLELHEFNKYMNYNSYSSAVYSLALICVVAIKVLKLKVRSEFPNVNSKSLYTKYYHTV